MTQPSLVLYSRPDCPLCDEAEDLLRAEGLSYRWTTIEESLALLERYRDKIPVLRREDTGAELGWPFTRADIAEFVGTSQ